MMTAALPPEIDSVGIGTRSGVTSPISGALAGLGMSTMSTLKGRLVPAAASLGSQITSPVAVSADVGKAAGAMAASESRLELPTPRIAEAVG